MICKVCGSVLARGDALKRHMLTHSNDARTHKCSQCNYASNRKDALTRHVQTRHSEEPPAKKHFSEQDCRRTVDAAKTRPPLSRGTPSPADSVLLNVQDNLANGVVAESQSRSIIPMSNQLMADEAAISLLLERHRSRIETYTRRSRRAQDIFNYKLIHGSLSELMGYVQSIYKEQQHPFKLNVSFGFILQNYFTNELIFYYASRNTRLFPSPIMVEKQDDLQRIKLGLESEDLLEYARNQRPNTKYVVVMLTNAYFYVDKIKSYTIGSCSERAMPAFLRQKRSIIAFDKDHHNQREYQDGLCLFRCLAYHMQPTLNQITGRARRLQEKFCEDAKYPRQGFKGVTLRDLPLVEDTFEVNIEVFSLEQLNLETDSGENACEMKAIKQFGSRNRYPNPTMFLNLYDCHFSYITDIRAYSNRWACCKCGRLFNHLSHTKDHTRQCDNKTKHVFPGGGYGQRKNIFELLTENGIRVAQDRQYFPFRLTFDFESLFAETNTAPTLREELLSSLVPACVSVCSNVPGFTEPKWFESKGDVEQLMHEMYTYMVAISCRSYALMKDQFADAIAVLEDRINERQRILASINVLLAEGNDESVAIQTAKAYRLKVFESLYHQLEAWLRRIVCLGFNSGKFDFNLIRRYLFPYFLKNGITIDHIIKKNNDYMSVTTPDCLFLDIKNYLAAGRSYKKWIDSYEIPQTKGLFPYEWFTSLEKLDETKLPDKAAFWSELKQKGIEQNEYDELQNTWNRLNFQNMRDLLRWYNNLDVVPFLTAAEKLFAYWTSLKIDPFKGNAVSLPGLALNFLTQRKEKHTILPLFRPLHEDIYRLIRNNIVGGLSVVNHRYHERGVSVLPDGSIVAWIYSYDCNSLYLWALGEMTGTGIYHIWRAIDHAASTPAWRVPKDQTDASEMEQQWKEVCNENMQMYFFREASYTYYKKELEYLEWTAKELGQAMEHRFNGRQKIVVYDRQTRYPVDGYCPASNTIYQFHGCYFHGHGCALDQNNFADRQRKSEVTSQITEKLSGLGYTVIEKWECQWEDEKRRNPAIGKFVREHIDLKVKSSKLTAGQLLEKVCHGHIFGLIECDIAVPPWDQDLLDWFEEFPPICKNVEISIDDIGDHMRQYATETGYMTKPRKNLINSFWARKILLTTPIVQWMLQNGLIISRVYQLIEMKPKACFADIRDKIAHERRRADDNPAHKPSGESWKTLGNSLYGKTMTAKERHKNCKIVPDERAPSLINDPRFHSMEEIGDTAYEISMDKRRICQDLPITVAFFVYNYAKLRMLQFVFDFLKRYLRPGSFQIVCSDTDSIIAAYADRDLDKLVKPELYQEYIASGKKSFLATDGYTKRTPGLFKEELGATGIIALCSKTYFAWNDEENSTKISSKRLSKTTNSFSKTVFADVLRTKEKGQGTNYGFKVKRDELFQYKQTRFGLPYLYVKRRVRADGISTTALHL